MIFNVLTSSVDIHQMYICIWDAYDYELRISHCFEKKHGTSPILIQLLTFLDTSVKFNNRHAIFSTYLHTSSYLIVLVSGWYTVISVKRSVNSSPRSLLFGGYSSLKSVGNSFELTFNVFLSSIAVLFFPLCPCLGPAQLYQLLGTRLVVVGSGVYGSGSSYSTDCNLG